VGISVTAVTGSGSWLIVKIGVCSFVRVVPPDDGQVIPETCRHFEPQ
jgi:hypothetical protein